MAFFSFTKGVFINTFFYKNKFLFPFVDVGKQFFATDRVRMLGTQGTFKIRRTDDFLSITLPFKVRWFCLNYSTFEWNRVNNPFSLVSGQEKVPGPHFTKRRSPRSNSSFGQCLRLQETRWIYRDKAFDCSTSGYEFYPVQ